MKNITELKWIDMITKVKLKKLVLDEQNLNQGGTGLDELSAYEKLIDGVIHFRVRASRSEALGVREYVPSENPFSGFEDVRYVEVELAEVIK